MGPPPLFTPRIHSQPCSGWVVLVPRTLCHCPRLSSLVWLLVWPSSLLCSVSMIFPKHMLHHIRLFKKYCGDHFSLTRWAENLKIKFDENSPLGEMLGDRWEGSWIFPLTTGDFAIFWIFKINISFEQFLCYYFLAALFLWSKPVLLLMLINIDVFKYSLECWHNEILCNLWE